MGVKTIFHNGGTMEISVIQNNRGGRMSEMSTEQTENKQISL